MPKEMYLFSEKNVEQWQNTWNDGRVKSKPKPKPKPKPKVNQALYDGLSEAFDEGAACPYDLKDSAIREIIGKMGEVNVKASKNISSSTKSFIAKQIDLHMHGLVRECLQRNECRWLSGGRVLHLILGSPNTTAWTISDWDIFCQNGDTDNWPIPIPFGAPDAASNAHSYEPLNLRKNAPLIDKIYYSSAIDAVGRSQTVNIITGNFRKPSDFYLSFDLRMLQMAFWYEKKKPQFEVTGFAWTDLISSIIKLANPRKLTEKTRYHLTKRIKKYMMRGFRDGTGLVETGFLAKVCASQTSSITPPK